MIRYSISDDIAEICHALEKPRGRLAASIADFVLAGLEKKN